MVDHEILEELFDWSPKKARVENTAINERTEKNAEDIEQEQANQRLKIAKFFE